MTLSPLKQLSFKSYKAFGSEQHITLTPLTLIYGYNNSGKSAVVRLLPLLASSFAANRLTTFNNSYLNYCSESIRGASFKDLAFSNGNRMEFGLKWENGHSIKFGLRKDGAEEEKLTFLELSQLTTEKTQKAKYVECLSGKNGDLELDNDENKKLKIESFDLSKMTSTSEPEINTFTNNLTSLSSSVSWLSSIRVHPSRNFEIGAGIPLGIKSNGQGTAETIWHLAESSSPSFSLINDWLIQTCNRKIDIEGFESKTIDHSRRRVRLDTVSVSPNKLKHQSLRIPVLDLGEGIAQALPVVTLIAMAANKELGPFPIICIEQPELHLHPKAIVDLANFIVTCVKDKSNIRLIIETHSESLLLALQTALVEEDLSSNDVSCYWIEPDEDNSSKIETVSFDSEGFMSDNWPIEVFGETLTQQKKLIRARRNDK